MTCLFRSAMILASLASAATWHTAPARGDAPRAGASPLAALVPADAGLCLELRGLAAQAGQFDAAPLADRLLRFPPLAKRAEESRRQWDKISSELQLQLGATADEIAEQLLGHEALFAVWPPEAGAAQGHGLFLTQAADAKFLHTTVERLVAVLRAAGQWNATHAVNYAGGSCQVHEVASPDGGLPLFLTAVDRLGIVANSRNLVRDVLALEAGETLPRGSLDELAAYRTALGRVSAEASLRLFVNPRPWDRALEADLQNKAPGSPGYRTHQMAVETWQATDYAVVAIEFARQICLEGFVAWNQTALPLEVREAAASLSGRATLLDHVPSDAVAAAVGSIDLGRLLRQAALADPATRGGAGLTPGWLAALTIASGLGPDAATYLARPAPATDEAQSAVRALPFDWVVAIATRPLEVGDGRPSLAEILEPVLHSALSVAAAARRTDALRTTDLRSLEVDGIRMTSITGWGPPQHPLEATYAVVDNQFWGGTSPAAVGRAARLKLDESLARSPEFQRRKSPRLDAPSQLVYLDFAGLRQWLQNSPEALAWLAEAKGLDQQAAERSHRELLSLLELADVLVAAVEVRSSGFAISLSLTADDSPLDGEQERIAPSANQTPGSGVEQ